MLVSTMTFLVAAGLLALLSCSTFSVQTGIGSPALKMRHEEFDSLKEECPLLSEIVSCPNDGNSTTRDPEEFQCRDCAARPWQNTFHARNDTLHQYNQSNKIHLFILAPAFFGSSTLLNILSSSPQVSNMCADPFPDEKNKTVGWMKTPWGRVPWMCESTNIMIHEGVYTRKGRHHKNGTNWTRVFDIMDNLPVWKNPSAPIRLDKTPPTFKKVPSLMKYFRHEDPFRDYRFVVLMRHPCRKEWHHNVTGNLKFILSDEVPKHRRFLINYDDLITQPVKVMRGLFEWLPLLGELSLNTQEIPSRSGRRRLGGLHGGSLYEYVFSDHCTFTRIDENTVDTAKMSVWRDFLRQQQNQFQLDVRL